GRPESQTNLADILERVLDKGIVIAGDIQINLLDIELLTIKLRLLIASVDRAREMGINWWESDSSLQSLDAGEADSARLERVARAHEKVLEAALEAGTIVPLRLCTIYESEAGVRRMLQDEGETLARALEILDGRQEWGVKLLVDSEKLASAARARSDEAGELDDELRERTEGGAYMLRRRFERRTREVADALAAEVAEDVHRRLAAW